MSACVRTPKRDSYGETACKVLFQRGALTLDEAISIHGNMGDTRSDTLEVYRKAMQYDFIFEKFNRYYLAPYLHSHIKKLVEGDTEKAKSKPALVQKRTNLSRGEMPVQERDKRLRPDIFFKTVGGI
jgi:hypothetical protein